MNLISAINRYQNELLNLQNILVKLEETQKYADHAEPITLEGVICKRYLQLGIAEAVAKEINAAGFKNNGRVYIAKDITSLINQRSIKDVDPILHKGAQLLLKINKCKI